MGGLDALGKDSRGNMEMPVLDMKCQTDVLELVAITEGTSSPKCGSDPQGSTLRESH